MEIQTHNLGLKWQLVVAMDREVVGSHPTPTAATKI